MTHPKALRAMNSFTCSQSGLEFFELFRCGKNLRRNLLAEGIAVVQNSFFIRKIFSLVEAESHYDSLKCARSWIQGSARNPRPTRHFELYNDEKHFCTTRAAVINSLLDRTIPSRFEFVSREKIFRELFHTTNFFVLVCGLFTF
jgi:hypothetical protein